MKEKIIVGMLLILKALAVLAIPTFFVLYIYTLVVYGDTPVMELPTWVVFVLGK